MPYRELILAILLSITTTWPTAAQDAQTRQPDCSRVTAALAVSELQWHLSELQRLAIKAGEGAESAYKDLRAERKVAEEHFERVKKLDFDVGRLGLDAQQSLFHMDRILESQEAIIEAHELVSNLRKELANVATKGGLLTQALSDAGASPAQVQFAGQLQLLILRMHRQINTMLHGNDEAAAANRLERTFPLLRRRVDLLIMGSEEDGIESVEDREALNLLGELFEKISTIDDSVQTLLERSFELEFVRSANESFESAVQEIQQESKELKVELKNARG